MVNTNGMTIKQAQAAVAAERSKDTSYIRAAANASKSGDTKALEVIKAQTTDIIGVSAGAAITQAITKPTQTLTALKQAEENKMPGSTYDKLDAALGGWLPGGSTAPSALSQSIALKAAGATGAVAAGYGIYTLADQMLFNGSLPLGAANQSTGAKKKYRRMNYDNPKALGRSERRLKGFLKHYKSHVSALGYTVSRRHTK